MQYKRLYIRLFFSCEMGLISMVSFIIGYGINNAFHAGQPYISGLWVAISAILVLQSSYEQTRHFAAVRISGSFIGALVPGIMLYLLPHNILAVLVIVSMSSLICKLCNFDEGMRLAALTSSVIIAISYAYPDAPHYLNATLRFLESVAGTCLALLFRFFTQKLENYFF